MGKEEKAYIEGLEKRRRIKREQVEGESREERGEEPVGESLRF